MIEITKDQCTRMLVWDVDESKAKERDVYAYFADCIYPYKILYEDGSTGSRMFAKALPEPKQMTALDVMWWTTKIESTGVCVVIKHKDCEGFDNCMPEFIEPEDQLSDYRFNLIIRENGETKLKYDTWKEFNFENCEMGE